MDSVYDTGPRTWVSELICLKDYFSKFVCSLPTIETNKTKSQKKDDSQLTIGKLMNVTLTDDELNILSESCSLDKLKVPDEPVRVEVKTMKARPGLYDKSKIPAAAMELETIKHLKQRMQNYEPPGNLKYRSSIWPAVKGSHSMDLTPGKHILLIVRVYHPFRHRIGVRNSQPPRCSQEVIVLGDQHLTVLRDKITCPADACVLEDLSKNPDKEFTKRAKDIYKSGFIFIENTFYNDHRHPENIDYSNVIRNWAKNRNLGPFNTAVMENTKFEDLSLRLGYPYVYQHQGNCEHLIVFGDVRLIHKSDVLCSLYYPCIRSMSSSNAQYCMICGIYVAGWITTENERVPHDPCYFCDLCFISYNYVDGKKVGNFKAFPFFGKP